MSNQLRISPRYQKIWLQMDTGWSTQNTGCPKF